LQESERIPFYTTITREYELVIPQSKLDEINKISGLTTAEEILEFCRTPRTAKEINAFLRLNSAAYIKRTYINPLIENGKLIQTIPIKSSKPKFVTAEFVMLIPTEEAVLDFCKEPRMKSEIIQHFGLSYFVARKIYDPLIESGKLIGDTSEMPKNIWQKFVAANAGYAVSKKERIIQFCQTSKSRSEIAEHFNIHLKYAFRYIKPFVESGVLKMTKPDTPSSIDQRFYSGDTDVMILSETTVRAFCQFPRGRQEIAEHFGIKRYLADRYINEYVRDNKLKMTMPINPICKQQRFVDGAAEIGVFSEETLLEYCKTPRSKEEIYKRFGISTKDAVSNFINPLLNNGKLKRTIPQYRYHKMQRFYSV
jgi:predicted transcriptional regulator